MAAYLFLGRNGYEFTAEEKEVVIKALAVAAGELDEQHYAAWLKMNSKPTRKRKS